MKNMKTTLKILSLGVVAILAACTSDSNRTTSSSSVAQTRAYEAGMNENWSRNGTTVQVADGRSGGSQQQQQQKPKPAPAPAPAPKPAPAPTRTVSAICSEAIGGIVPTTITMPREAAYGQEFTYDINVTAAQCASHVIVTDSVPQGAKFVRSEPAAEQDANHLRWNLGDMDKGASQTIHVTLKADQEGTLTSCASISADPRTCGQIFIGRPTLALTKSGPATAIVGQQIVYTITIANKGTLTAHNVMINGKLPPEMEASVGQQEANLQVGDLAPNETKTYSITVKGLKKGKYCNVAHATSSNAGTADAEACTTFLQPGLKITKEGPKQQFLSRQARYTIVVSNTGDTPLTGVTVTDIAPSGTTIASADGGTVSGDKAVWNVGTLAAGADKSLTVNLRGTAPGSHCNSATVTTTEGLTQTAEACTVWQGVGALLLETLDDPDPIQVNENTTYKVRVTNQGTADDTNIKMVVEFTAEIDPVSASNGGVINGKTVTFPPYARLGSKQAFEYTIVGKGVKVGDARTKFIRTSDSIPAPTTSEESTRVY
jgi:uncharacterized repeat protein (TIGR01451 family)